MLELEQIAEVCHEANRVIQRQQKAKGIPVSPPWAKLDEHTRASAVSGVLGVVNGNNPEESHANWMAFKIEAGWRYGDVKDDVELTHPLLIPYGDLPSEAKLKDALFGAIVRAMVAPSAWAPSTATPEPAPFDYKQGGVLPSDDGVLAEVGEVRRFPIENGDVIVIDPNAQMNPMQLGSLGESLTRYIQNRTGKAVVVVAVPQGSRLAIFNPQGETKNAEAR